MGLPEVVSRRNFDSSSVAGRRSKSAARWRPRRVQVPANRAKSSGIRAQPLLCHNNKVDRELRWYRSARRHRIGKVHAMHVINSIEPEQVAATASADARLVWIGKDDRHRTGDRCLGPRRVRRRDPRDADRARR